MKSVVVTGPDTTEVLDVERPAVGASDALIRVRACGICGSDAFYIHIGGIPPRQGATPDRLVSPANPADTTDLAGIAPALVITPELDRLHDEGKRYAQRLRAAGALVEHHDVPQADHGYDMSDTDKARQTYALIARCIKQATEGPAPAPTRPSTPTGN
jgi:acetyl esterase/lipase